MSRAPEPARTAALDGLRGVAVLMVVFSHFYPEDRLPSRLLHCGRLGVVLFFALSGYLITNLLLRSRDIVDAGRRSRHGILGAFYVRRVLRILPAYGLALLLCCVLGYRPVIRQLPWLLTYTVNLAQAFRWADFGYADHFWSLAVEEQFYLVWPLAIFYIAPARLRHALVAIPLLAAAATLSTALAGGFYLACFRLPFLGSLVPLALGSLLAEIRWRRPTLGVERRLLGIAIGVGLPLLVLTQIFWFSRDARSSPWYFGVVDVPMALLALAVLVVLSSDTIGPARLRAVFSSFPLTGIGRISYGIYVGHRLLPAAWPGLFTPEHPLVGLLGGGSLSIALAAASWVLIERPLLSLKRLFPYEGSSPASSSIHAAAEVDAPRLL